MAEDSEKAVATANEQQKKVPGKPFTPGDPRINRNGRPQGTQDFKTKWFAFVEKVAKSNDMTPEEINEQLLAVGFKKAKEGDYSFYRDIHDRVYGKPMQITDVTSNGESIAPLLVKFIDGTNDNRDTN